jgi:hypothetical protein
MLIGHIQIDRMLSDDFTDGFPVALYSHSISETTQNSRCIKQTLNLNKHSNVFTFIVLKSGVTNAN